jgi:hypothetical protein
VEIHFIPSTSRPTETVNCLAFRTHRYPKHNESDTAESQVVHRGEGNKFPLSGTLVCWWGLVREDAECYIFTSKSLIMNGLVNAKRFLHDREKLGPSIALLLDSHTFV